MEPFATVADLEARWRPLDEAEKAKADVLLGDASVLIAQRCRNAGVKLDMADGLVTETLRAITCEVVKRSMLSPTDRPAATNTQMVAGPYSESVTFANPTGDIYLTHSEQARLGIGKQRIGFVRPAIHCREGGEVNDW
jgi:hypothetical protein